MTRQLISPASLLLAFALVLAACGSDDRTESPEAPADSAVDPAADTAGEAGFRDAQKAYLVAYDARDDTEKTESGLLYRIIETGDGATPRRQDEVVVHYRGALIDGTEFDSSYARGAPATFAAGGLIRGWVEALALMQAGDHWELAIPAELGYGERGSGAKIPPGATLVFEVELLDVIQKQSPEEFMSEQTGYLEENKKDADVKVTESGLQYKVITAGDGATPEAGAMVTVHYAGKLVDGSVFDSSYARGEPATFPSDRLIPGWVEALTMMQEGDKWELAIPADIGYGDNGIPGVIPGGATLLFTVELIKVN